MSLACGDMLTHKPIAKIPKTPAVMLTQFVRLDKLSKHDIG